MFFHSLETVRRIVTPLLAFSIVVMVLATFGARWSSDGFQMIRYTVKSKESELYSGSAAAFAVILPYPFLAPFWFGFTAIVMYLNLAIASIYIFWNIIQIVIPDRFGRNSAQRLVFIDAIFSGVFAILLILAFSFYAGGLNGSTARQYVGFGYCFYFTIVASITCLASFIIAMLGVLRGN